MRVHYPNELLIGAARKYHRVELPENEARDPAMTLAQASYLMMLCEETHEVLDDALTETQAAQRIAELEEATGRTSGHGSPKAG